MIINGKTQTCGLIGNPVEHTLSPVIHNTLAELTGKNLVYVPFLVKQDLKQAVEGAFALSVTGLNVTIPYKEKVIPFLTGMDELAAKIGAVNTLVRGENGYTGYNTDMPGLYRAMQSDGVMVDGKEVIILGAGGVARAVAVMLSNKASHIYILNRTLQKAAEIAEEVNGYAKRKMATAMALSEYGMLPDGKYVVIQATNIGMYPDTGKAVIEEDAFYDKVSTGYDLIYNPGKTLFMKKTEQAGAKAYNGLKMLLFQGIIAYELWNDCRIPEDMAEQVYKIVKESL